MAVSTAAEDRLINVTDAWEQWTGYRRAEAVGRTLLDLGLFENPEDYHRIRRHLDAHGSVRRVEHRFLTRDGSILIGALSAQRFVVDDQPLRIVAIEDCSSLRLSEQASSSLARALIVSQEEERRRLARDLHDDIGQRLAILQIGIDQVRHELSARPGESAGFLGRMDGLSKQAADVAVEIRTVTQALRSPKLDFLPLAEALRGVCDDVRQQVGLDIEFSSHDVAQVGAAITLCLFRVLEDALKSATRHGGKGRVAVELWGAAAAIHLRIRDFGSGLSTITADAHRLSLLTMQERVSLVDGTLAITSSPGLGTEISVRIPLPSSEI
jgi:PAS domain S-box-containing protein